MKNILLLLALLCVCSAHAVDGLTIPNSHQVDKGGYIFRGKEPRKLVTELKDFGITDVLIFKNDVRGEVVQEVAALKSLGIKPHHIPFRWKEYASMEDACAQVVDGLNLMYKVKQNGGAIFLHCTAGEDRTGVLAGLYRMLEERISTANAFRYEMCSRGYSDGNPHKPGIVTGAIQKELTPLFIALSQKVERGEWTLGTISKRSCQGLKVSPTNLKCRP
jgi:hypothetical protein